MSAPVNACSHGCVMATTCIELSSVTSNLTRCPPHARLRSARSGLARRRLGRRMPLAVLVAFVRRGDFEQHAMRALRRNPSPLLPRHIRIVVSLAAPGELNSLAGQLGQCSRHIGGGKAQMMHMLAHLLQAIAERRSRRGLNELNLG